MAHQQLFIVHGMGQDAVGLVGKITSPIAKARGNILDSRQDVLHGLFTIYLVVDVAESSLDEASLRQLAGKLETETGLLLSVAPYTPVARSAEKRNLLMVLMGRDRAGIIGASSEMLGKYNANIEFSQTIAREGVFLMELLTDISHVAIPLENLKRTLSKNMEALSIKTVFQDDDVFNKRKRVILFHITSSFMDPATRRELMEQTGLTSKDLQLLQTRQSPLEACRQAASLLDGLPLDVVDAVLETVAPTPGTLELIQTLKIMGYKIALVSRGLSFFTDHLRTLLAIDYAFGMCLPVDDDARTVVGEILTDAPGSHDLDAALRLILSEEQISEDDLAVMTDEGCDQTPGLRLQFDLKRLLNLFNQRILTREQILGLVGSFGTPVIDD